MIATAVAGKAPSPVWVDQFNPREDRVIFVAQTEAETARPDSLRPAEWRRTNDGWQPLDHLMARRPQESWTAASRLHPLVVGSFLILASLGALLFFEKDGAREFLHAED